MLGSNLTGREIFHYRIVLFVHLHIPESEVFDKMEFFREDCIAHSLSRLIPTG